jgi:hypothetical protein
MRSPIDSQSNVLPMRFPVGARYVVEGRGGKDGRLRVFSRYVVLPGGQRINVPSDLGQLPAARAKRSRNRHPTARATAKKNLRQAGTSPQHRN